MASGQQQRQLSFFHGCALGLCVQSNWMERIGCRREGASGLRDRRPVNPCASPTKYRNACMHLLFTADDDLPRIACQSIGVPDPASRPA
ncbi:hypothetical protein VTN96DRAFT_5892 [Rasamsonia emersonii]